MSTWDGGFSRGQNFHPEFGYLCPTAQFRRKARNVVITLAAGGLIAGSVALALLPQLAPQASGDRGHEATTLSAMAAPPVDKATDFKTTSPTDPTDQGVPAATVAPAVVTERAASAHAQASCDDLPGAFLAPQCRLGKTGKSRATRTAHVAHAAATEVAAVSSTGRPDAALRAGPQEAAAQAAGPQESGARVVAPSRPAPAAEAAATVAVADEAPQVALPLPRPAALDKKPVKTVHKPAPAQQAPGREIASADAVPAGPSHGFDLFALFHQPPRTGAGFWSFQ
jgi:hypothetical protein